MAKNLELQLNLPISDANEALIALVATANGWDADRLLGTPDEFGNPTEPISANEYVCQFMLKKEVIDYIAGKVSSAFDWYYGASQGAMKQQVMAALGEELQVTAEIKDRTDG